MKNINKKTIIIAISTLLIGLLFGWLLFGNNKIQPDGAEDAAQEKTEITWICSMHPQVRKNEPGNCPICDMELIPLENNDAEIDPMSVQMSATAMQLAQVETMVVGKSTTEKAIRLNGKVQADERRLFTQATHIAGRVEKLGVNFTGEYISQGQVIAYIYSPELLTAQKELFEAQKIKETQPELFNAAKDRLKNWKLTDKQIDGILASNKSMEQFPILANVSGYVTKKMVTTGDYIKQGEAIYEIADLSKVWVLFDVYESELAWLNKGDKISYTVNSIAGKTFDGTVTYIDPVIDAKTRVAKARVETNNSDLLLKPEMFASGTLKAQIKAEGSSITVPKTAVMWTGKRSVVYVMQNVNENISFRMREVGLGAALGERFVIENGLQLGEEIAVNGTFSIDAAAQLAGKPSMMNPDGGVSMTGHNHGGASNSKMEEVPDPAKKVSVSVDAKKALEFLYDDYFEMKTALAADNFKKAKEAGIAMNKSLEKVDMNLFKGDAHALWMELSAALKKNTQHIEHLANIDVMREAFMGISNAMIAMAETFEPNAFPIYVQNCPMADNNKGADWLSMEKEILNPYFGQSMLKCGGNIKTIE